MNQEFQSLLTEIDRQAQSIGLSQGGEFARSLDVFIGGGKTNSGGLDTVNGTVTVNLSSSAVDTKSMGLKGFQVIAGSANLATGDTTVQKIVQQAANGTSGTTDFYFAGPGFSDNSKVKISVNLQGVTDLNTLVTNINAAIQNAGNSGTSQAVTAFKNAGIVASVHSENGSQQLAFTSSTSAFQVSAGDKMSNALMGNFADASTATGKSISTTLTGGTYDATGADPFDPSDVTVRISGAGLSSPVDVTLSSAAATVTDALTELVHSVNNDANLQAAGISVAQDTDTGKLVFTGARGESFSVEATGDTQNQLGLGSFVAGLNNAVDYTTIAGTGYSNTSTAIHGTADLAISLNGAATSSTIQINLAQGNATQAQSSGAAVSDGIVIDDTNKSVAFSVDGVDQTFDLQTSTPATEAIKAGTVHSADAGITLTAASGGQTSTVVGTRDYSVAASCHFSGAGNAKTFTVNVDGDSTAQSVTLDQDYADGAAVATAIRSKLSGANVTYSAGAITITSATTGSTSSVQIGGADRAALGFADAALHQGGNGNNVLSFSADGGSAQTVTLTAGTYTGATLLTELNARLNGSGVSAGFAGVTTGFTSDQYSGLGNALVFKSTSGTGAGKSLVFNNTNPTNAAANTLLGISNPASAVHGTDAQKFTLADIAGQINTHLAGAGTASAANGTLTLKTATYGTSGSVQITGNNATLGLSSGAAVAGHNRDAADIVKYLNDAFSTDTTLKPAALTASQSGGVITVASGNQTYFRVNAGGSQATANIGFGVEGATFAGLTGGAATSNASVLDASGTSYVQGGLSFTAMKYGNDDQSVTVSAVDPNGAMQSKTISLKNDGTTDREGRNIDETIAYINKQLQETNISTLQKIVAVKDNSGGTEKINFLSSLSSFSISTGSSANTNGVASGAADTHESKTNGTGGTVAIDTKASAQQAVAAVASAVQLLGSAQAAVGKGQNQLNYAVGLAQSQISNFSAAESRIRDADVASEAANLTKAQVLQQASIAAMAQANSAPQAVLSLLRG